MKAAFFAPSNRFVCREPTPACDRLFGSRGTTERVPLLLRAGEHQIEVTAGLDTGASFCLFERSVGEALGLEIELGEPRRLPRRIAASRHSDTKFSLMSWGLGRAVRHD
jgi:hypothetical protein